MKGKVLLITGAATGIGAAMSRLFSSRGALVILADVAQAKAESVAEDIVKDGGRALAVPIDVANRREVDAAIAGVLQTWGRIDILINNAAVNYFTQVEEVTDDEWESVLGVNVRGVYNCSRAVIPSMKRRGWGRIVNISSSAGKTGGPVSSIHYSASKAAVICMTKSFARHLASSGVTVNSIAPGVVGTDMVQLLPEDARSRAIQAIPLQRFALPVEIACAAAFLCSEEAAYITGEVLDVNGGALMD